MATIIEYGGKPSYELRVEASKPAYGSQISGYTGVIPGMKFKSGQNSSTLTHQLSKKPQKHSPISYGNEVNMGIEFTEEYIKQKMEPLNRELSAANREQKYVFDLPPGYGGFIPKFLKNSLGMTFNRSNFKALEEQILSRKEFDRHLAEIKEDRARLPCMKAIKCEADESLYIKKTVAEMKPCGHPSRIYPLEPPIVGYMGWVPRTQAMIESLGMDYHQQAAFGLKTFNCYQEYYKERLKNPRVYMNREASKYRASPDDDLCLPSAPHHRLYSKSGLVPGYTGVVPGVLFDYARTYGDAARSMECCQHDDANYGFYMKKKIATSPVEYGTVIS